MVALILLAALLLIVGVIAAGVWVIRLLSQLIVDRSPSVAAQRRRRGMRDDPETRAFVIPSERHEPTRNQDHQPLVSSRSGQ